MKIFIVIVLAVFYVIAGVDTLLSDGPMDLWKICFFMPVFVLFGVFIALWYIFRLLFARLIN